MLISLDAKKNLFITMSLVLTISDISMIYLINELKSSAIFQKCFFVLFLIL